MALISFIHSLDLRTVLVLLIVFVTLAWWVQRSRDLPPGPWRFPIVGFVPQLLWFVYRGEPLHELVTRLGKKHGVVYSFDLFGKVVVVMNDFATMREGNNNPALQNKGYTKPMELLLGNHAHSYKHNAEYRKFAIASLRGLGLGKQSFETDITDECKVLLYELNALEGRACNPYQYLEKTAAHVLLKVLLGKQEYDERFNHLLELNRRMMELWGTGAWSLKLLPSILPTKNGKKIARLIEEMHAFLGKLIAEHRDNLDCDKAFDFIDLSLKEIDQNPIPDDPLSYLHDRSMKGALLLMLIGGVDPAAITLAWCCLYMMAYPEIQEKVHEEIDSVVGRNRLPLISDEQNLPYTKATLLEVQRHVTLVPLSDFKEAGAETTLRGYRIPQGATILSNLYAVMHDSVAFSEPEQFKPERFIGGNGEYVERKEAIPFGVGRRSCPGDNVAKMEMFIIFSHLLHRFSIEKPDDIADITLEGIHGAIYSPKPFTAKFVPRN